MEPLTPEEQTLLRICFHERLRGIQIMRERRRWTREEMERAISEVNALALKFGMQL
jgi:hypothetical protein